MKWNAYASNSPSSICYSLRAAWNDVPAHTHTHTHTHRLTRPSTPLGAHPHTTPVGPHTPHPHTHTHTPTISHHSVGIFSCFFAQLLFAPLCPRPFKRQENAQQSALFRNKCCIIYFAHQADNAPYDIWSGLIHLFVTILIVILFWCTLCLS